MKAVRALRKFSSIATALSSNPQNYAFFHRFYSAHPQLDDPSPPNPNEFDPAVFDSSHFDDINLDSSGDKQTWDVRYRDRVRSQVFGEDISHFKILKREEEKKKKAARLAKDFLEAALNERLDEEVEEREAKEEDQKSLAVGVIGAPNAGKSSLTNYMVGTKVSAVSRKVNTTTNEVLGVLTKGDTQSCFFDTPGLMLKKNGFP